MRSREGQMVYRRATYKSKLLSEDGLTLIEVLIASFIISLLVLSTSEAITYFSASHHRNKVISTVLAIESELLSAMMGPDTFSDQETRLRMLDGSQLPSIEIRNWNAETIVVLPASARKISDLGFGVKYFTANREECAGFGDSRCVIKVEASMIMVAGKTNRKLEIGPPEWIPVGSALENSSPYPLYAVAYRISLNPKEKIGMRPRGLTHMGALTLEDHRWAVSPDLYMAVKEGSVSCLSGSFFAGINPSTGEPVCVKLAQTCESKTMLAKEISIDGTELKVDCVSWKKFSCPENYVVSVIAPTMLDPDRNGTLAPAPGAYDYGSCVYIGRDVDTITKSNAPTVQVKCPSKYTASPISCMPADIVATNCVAPDGSTAIPNPGTTTISVIDASTVECQINNPTPVCSTPYSGGSWTAKAELAVECTIRPDEKYRPMEIE